MGTIANKLLELNTAKHAIRAAINSKGGTLTKGSPLSAYPAAIEAIGVDTPYELMHVVFIDYDGTVLKDAWVAVGDPVTAPTPPAHPHLTFRGWNRSAASLASVKHDMCVGALYDVEDGVNWLRVNVAAGSSITLKFTRNTNAPVKEVDWGDGTVETLTSDTSKTHTYADGYTGWVKLTGLCLQSATASSSQITNLVVEMLVSWWKTGNAVFATGLEAVCFGYGCSASSTFRSASKMRGVVFGGNTNTVQFTFDQNSGYPVGRFHFSQAEEGGNKTSGTPTSAIIPIVEQYASTSSALEPKTPDSIVYFNYTGSISAAAVISRMRVVGTQFASGTLNARQVIIDEGAVPAGQINLYYNEIENFLDLINRLGDANLTISLWNVPVPSRDAISAILTPKGYTIAYS